MRNSVGTAWLVALALVVLAGPALGGPRRYTVYRAKSPPRLDGSLDEECWRAVPWESGFTLLGGDGVGPQFQTQFAMVWDDQCLYVAVRALEPEMSNLVARAPSGSNDLFRDDRIEISLASESDRAHWHQLVVNSRGRGLDFSYAAREIAGRRTLPESAPWRLACGRKGICWEMAIAIPLGFLNVQPREGMALVGNVARARAVEQPEQYRTTWTPLVSDFAEPDAFGVLRFAGLPPPEAAGRSLAAVWSPDVVLTIPGDRLQGAVAGLGGPRSEPAGSGDGWLRMTVPEIPNEVRLNAQLLDRIELAPMIAPGAGDRVTLANGDYVLGEIRSVGAERTVLSNPRLGELNIPTASLAEIRLGAAARAFLDTPFDLGDMAPWMAAEGKWAMEKGRLVAHDGGVIAAVLPQDASVTFEADVESLEKEPVQFEAVLFASHSSRPALGSGVIFHYEESAGRFMVWNRPPVGKGNWVQSFQFARDWRGGRFRCAYDPKDGAVRAWHDQATEGPFTARDAPKTGRYILFIARSPLAVKRLRMLPGIVTPGGESEHPGGAILVKLSNGDLAAAKSVTFSDGRFSISAAYGELQVAPGGVAWVRFPVGGNDAIAGGKPTIRVATTEGCLTLNSTTLSAERLAGRSEFWGAVSIPRECVRSMDFRRASQ